MIETQGDARRLASIDGATSLGQMADRVVVAALHWRQHRQLEAQDVDALRRAADWLGSVELILSDPLSLSSVISRPSEFPELDSFAPGLAGVALGELGSTADKEGQGRALGRLRELLLALANGSAGESDTDRVVRIFEAFAQAMLASADSMLATTPGTSWTTTPSF
jgi:hypothetical protein